MFRYVSPQQFADLTGWSIATVRRRLRARQLPALQPGGRRARWLIDLDAFVQGSSSKTEPLVASLPDTDPPALRDSTESKPANSSPKGRPSKRGPKPKWKNLKDQFKQQARDS